MPRTAQPARRNKRHCQQVQFRMDRGARRWMIKVARQELWKLQPEYDLDDALQEGLLCWHIAVSRYGEKVDGYPHLMGLFKSIYTNRLHNLARQVSKRSVETPFADLSDEAAYELADSRPCEFSELLRFVIEAPSPLDELLALLIAGKSRRRKGKRTTTRETGNEELARVLGVPRDRVEDVDLRGMLEAHLKGS